MGLSLNSPHNATTQMADFYVLEGVGVLGGVQAAAAAERARRNLSA